MTDTTPRSERWARFRFAVIGALLADPPADGELRLRLDELAARAWTHPISGKQTRFGFSTIERWYYRARAEDDPVAVLRRKVRRDADTSRRMTSAMAAALIEQYRHHPSWSYRLHAENLRAHIAEVSLPGVPPSDSTVRRFMKHRGFVRLPRRGKRSKGTHETRSYEKAYVNALWHIDFHVGSRPVLLADGTWQKPQLFACVDDRSRLVCHAQWYLSECTHTVVHGLTQAIHKRGLPRALMSDRGTAELSGEVLEGLQKCGIDSCPTASRSPEMNAKVESLWNSVEGHFLPMLERFGPLDLPTLERYFQAWVEFDYNRSEHGETGQPPIERFAAGPDVGRPSPSSNTLRARFTVGVSRTQRRSDGTFSLDAVRFEVPGHLRHLERLTVRYARWDLSRAWLVDPRREDAILAVVHPIDKQKNADGYRKPLNRPDEAPKPPERTDSHAAIAPLLRRHLAEQAATGLPPAYLPLDMPYDGKE